MPITTCASSPAVAHRPLLPETPIPFRHDPMILSCPACQTRYLVDEKALRGSAGRTVRCANCAHTWHQSAPSEPYADEEAAELERRIEPALEVPPRPGASPITSFNIPERSLLVPEPAGRKRTRRVAIRWLVLGVLFALAILAGVVVARGAVVPIWPPAGRLFTLAGLPVALSWSGLKIGKLMPTRSLDGVTIEGDITNTGYTTRDLPRLRVALHDVDQEVPFKIIDPPQLRLAAGAVAHFKTPLEHPEDAATRVVVVTFAKHQQEAGSWSRVAPVQYDPGSKESDLTRAGTGKCSLR